MRITGRRTIGRMDGIISSSSSAPSAPRPDVFADRTRIGRSNLVDLISDLSQKIAQTIVEQSTNFIASTLTFRVKNALRKSSGNIKDGKTVRRFPSKSMNKCQAVRLRIKLRKRSWVCYYKRQVSPSLTKKSDVKPDVLITGDAVAATTQKSGNFFSGHAILEIKAQERTTGKILVAGPAGKCRR